MNAQQLIYECQVYWEGGLLPVKVEFFPAGRAFSCCVWFGTDAVCSFHCPEASAKWADAIVKFQAHILGYEFEAEEVKVAA